MSDNEVGHACQLSLGRDFKVWAVCHLGCSSSLGVFLRP